MNSAIRTYQEKRGFIRMKIETPAHVDVINSGETFSGICKDLSGGGMLLEIDTALPIGSQLQVRITSAHGHAPILNANTRVARILSQPSATESRCLLGLEITDVIE